MAMPARRRSTKAPASSPMSETHKGYIRRIFFTNPENGYTVFKFFSADDRQEFTAVGHILNPRSDDEYLLRGEFAENPKFRRQFIVTEHQLLLPSTTKGVVSYLCAFGTGIGPAKARRIVDTLGEDCLERIKADPKLLQTVPGITTEQAGEVAKHLLGNVVLAELTALICREGVTANLATKIYSKYGAESVQVVKENPYVLADDIYGVGFVIADRVAGAVGLQANNPYRVEAAVMYVLREAANGDGHCYLRPSQIVKGIYSLLTKHCGIEVEDIGAAVVRLHGQGRVIREGPKGEFVYTREMHGAEMGVAAALRRLMAVPVAPVQSIDELRASIEVIEIEGAG